MNDLKEKIYNEWLRATALRNNRGYRRRKDLDGIKPEDSAALDRLYRIFSSCPGIDIRTYFMAGYDSRENDDSKFISLSEFAKQSMVRVYLNFQSSFDKDGFDFNEVVKLSNSGFTNILDTCVENKWTLAQYIGSTAIESDGVYRWIKDFASNRICCFNIISFYLIGFDVESAVRKTVKSEEDVFFGGRFADVVMAKIDNMDERSKSVLVAMLKKINDRIKIQLTPEKEDDMIPASQRTDFINPKN